ncbi:hypothetical protein [Microbacterium profundi]
MTTESTGISRRTLVKGAAWSMPVIAVAAATPLAAASVNTASAQWTASNTTLATLTLLTTGQPVAGLTLFPTAPTVFQINNTPGIIPNVTAIFSVALDDSLLNITVPVGDTRLGGFAPATIPGATLVGTTAVNERSIADTLLGEVFAQDTVTTFSLGDIASGATVDFGSIAWALVAKSGIALSLGVNTNFNVAVSLQSDGAEFATLAGSNITSFASAGII